MDILDLRKRIFDSNEVSRIIRDDATTSIADGPEQIAIIVGESNIEILLRRYISKNEDSLDGKWTDSPNAYMTDKMAIKLRDALITLFPVEKAKKLKR
ncbi:MAG: hypothetical protein PHX21_13085 [bacterium]|nr:hypothetical protein [bacterium]